MAVISEHEQREKRARERSDQRILSMTPDSPVSLSTDGSVRARMQELAQAIRDKDVERLLSLYAPDVVAFDLRPPLDTQGIRAYRRNFENWFASFEGRLDFELHNLRIVAGEATAFCHYLALVTGSRSAGRISGYWVRGTTCLERRDGQWLIVHEHVSTPTYLPRTGESS